MKKIRHMSKKIDIISLYCTNYFNSFSGRKIARMLNLNHQTVLNHINDLVSDKILKYELKGRNKEYSLNLENIQTTIFLEIMENVRSLKALENKELKFIIKDLIEKAESIIVFGSFADNSHDSKSDVDLLILGKSDKKQIKILIKRYNREINIEFVSFKDFANSLKKKKALAIEILKNHLIYGNISKIVNIMLKWYLR